jgi:probable rRNA maturation factor
LKGKLFIHNRQRSTGLDLTLLRRVARSMLEDILEPEEFELGIYLVDSDEMARFNQSLLRHQGTTDVITLDYGAGVPNADGRQARHVGRKAPSPNCPDAELQTRHADIFICLDEAILQARRYHTTWPAELARYLVHAALHLRGFDDRRPADRRRMKREEDRLLRRFNRRFPLSKLSKGNRR